MAGKPLIEDTGGSRGGRALQPRAFAQGAARGTDSQALSAARAAAEAFWAS